MKKLLTLVVAGLDHELVRRFPMSGSGLRFQPLETVFPALTCPVQGSLRTGLPPEEHGMVINGVYDHELAKVMFWEQSARLVKGKRIWEDFRSAGGRVGMMFWQQSLGEAVDWVLSPKPVHKHNGGLVQHCYSEPASLYDELKRDVGRPFKLQHYWGPLASAEASEWITDMLCAALARSDCPEWMFSYLPHLDYVLQREGPNGSSLNSEMEKLDGMLTRILAAAKHQGYDCVVVGDYAVRQVSKVVYPNRVLRDQEWFKVIQVGGKTYPDFFTSRAFAVVDHEVTEVVVPNKEDIETVRGVLENLAGVESVDQRTHADGTTRLVLTAEEGSWFAYPWWMEKREAPDFAAHVDIHNKPGFDPCELFFGWPPMSVGTNPQRVGGSHGRTGPGREVVWACTDLEFHGADQLCALSEAMKTYMAE